MKALAPYIVQKIIQNPRFLDIQESEPCHLSQLLKRFTRRRRELITRVSPEAAIARLRSDPKYLRETTEEIDGLWEIEMYIRFLMEGGPPATLQ